MNPHIVSAILTFSSTFFTTIGTLVVALNADHLDYTLVCALFVSALNTAIRATMKAYIVTP